MEGYEFRTKRFLARGNKLVIAALDHGAFHGPIDGLESPKDTCSQLNKADGVLMAPGLIRHVADEFTGSNAPPIITRLSWNSTYCFQWNYCESHHRQMFSARYAISLGADILLTSLSINTGSEEVDTNNVSVFCKIVEESHELGIPLIGEYYPANTEKMTAEELHEQVKIGCRVIAELGADIIKTFYTGENFSEIVDSTPVPIFVLGAEKTPTEKDALLLAYKAARSGARGIVFGRNIVQSRSPANFIESARLVMNNKMEVNEAVETYLSNSAKTAVRN